MRRWPHGFILGKTDWEYMVNCFCYGYKVGFRFTEFQHGPGNVDLTQCGSDVGPLAVLVEDCQPHAGIFFNNSQFMAAGKNQIEIDAAVRSAIVVGNRLRGGVKIANKSEGAQIGFNTSA